MTGPQDQLDNTATVTWPQQFLDNDTLLMATDPAPTFTFKNIAFTQTLVDNCVNVTDPVAASQGLSAMVYVGGPPNDDHRLLAADYVPKNDCLSYLPTLRHSRPPEVPPARRARR